MQEIFSEKDIPEGLKSSLAQLKSEKVRRSFLQILENAWNRNNNPNSL